MPDKPSVPPDEASSHLPRLEPHLFPLSMEVAATPMVAVREDGILIIVNRAARRLFGYESEELSGQPVELLLPEGLESAHQRHRADYSENPTPRAMGELLDLHGVLRDGSAVPLEIGLSPVITSSGLMTICTLVDISRRREEEEDLLELPARLEERNEQLLELVATDSLTSLRSGQNFLDHLSAQLEVSVRHSRHLSLLILDIDHFRTFNDTFGHLAGDEVLKEVGRIISEVGRRSDLVGRLGGEEFGVLLPETEMEGAAFLGNRFRAAVEAADWPLRSITVSVGATTIYFPDTTPWPEAPPLSEVLATADRALSRSKDRGRNRVTHSDDPDWMTR